VDNPHTKPLRFWEWLIHSIRRDHPEIIFLAEAFTRPKVMYELAKRGFSQSYTYFTWRTTAEELTAYFTELTQTEVGETFRPNLWPNTPDILPVHLQVGGRPTFIARVILAATLGASFGVYGPAYELCENVPLEPGKEEYQDSEKYQIRSWDTERADSLRPLLATLNRIRKQQPALQTNSGLTFHDTGNPGLIAYSKRDQLGGPVILTIVNLDPFRTQTGWVHFPAEAAALDPGAGFKVTDQLTGSVFSWGGTHHYVELNPAAMPAHVLVVGQG
jgi:starch synthase (maltosyl-transferring)